MNRFPRSLAVAIFLLVAAFPAWAQAPDEAPDEPAEATEASEVPQTDDEVMYRVMSAEMLGSQGEMEKAAAEYLAAALDSEDPEIAKRATEVAIAARAWQYAAMAADRWTVLAPDDPEAIESAARSLLLAGDFVGAEHQLQRLLEIRADDPRAAWGLVAALLGTSHHPEKTSQLLDRLIASQGAQDNAYALFASSQVAARSRELEKAMVLAEEAAQRAPDDPELQAWAGRVAMNLDDREAAKAHFKAAWEVDPQNRMIALLYAELLRQDGDSDQAHAILAALPDTPEMRFTRVAFTMQSGDLERAESVYRGFPTAAYANTIERAQFAARAAELLGLTEEAIIWYAQLDGTDQTSQSLQRRAVLLAQLDRVDEARSVLSRLQQNPDTEIRIEAMVVEGQVLLGAHRSQEAFEVLTRALEQFPGDIRLLYTRSLVAVDLDRIELAEGDLRQVIEKEPGNAAALNALGYTLADRTDRFEEAQALIEEAYRLQPEESSIIDSMGWVAFRQGRLEDAEKYLRDAFELDRNAEIAAHLGEVLWAKGEQEAARVVWSEGIEIDADNKILKETLERFGVTP
jgi:tetratricopeptide (TPR) repeat protein